MISLPIDVQLLILPLLTPTSLISLSQANQHLRRLINPQTTQFVDRLLELECLPEYGGEVVYHKGAVINPKGRVSYACTRCLKIISHTNFDNHALLRIRFRKPPPKSKASQKLCGWTNGDARAQGYQRQADRLNQTLGNWIRQNSSLGLPRSELLILYKIGSARHRRLCNECKFVTGFWSQNTGNQGSLLGGRNTNIGTASVPVVKGRHVRFHDPIERYFEGLFSTASNAGHTFRWQLYPKRQWLYGVLYSIRCPGCCIWQERAAFMRGSGCELNETPKDPSWQHAADDWYEQHFDKWRCHTCIAKSVGKEELGRQLLAFWKHLTEPEIQNVRCRTDPHDFDKIEAEIEKRDLWAQKAEMDSVPSQLIRRLLPLEEALKLDVEQRRYYFKTLRQWFDNLKDPTIKSSFRSQWDVDLFRERLDRLERLDDLKTFTRILEADPGRLVSFALDGYASLV